MSVLVVSGEPSGDRAAARVIARMTARGIRSFGLGGDASEREGAELVSKMSHAAMGIVDVAARSARIAVAMMAVRSAVRRRKPRAAILVNYTEFNALLLGFLRRTGVRVLWYAAPQIWAWRPRRGPSIARGVDKMAVILPFEEPLWEKCGASTRYVGHPAMETPALSREAARAELGLSMHARAVALLPGSRASEVRRLLPAMVEAAPDGHVLLSTALDDRTRAWARTRAAYVHEVDGASRLIGAFDFALCASGTASLEAALAGVPPVVVYRVDAIAAMVAKRALRTPFVALPNVLLGRRAFPELLQHDARADKMRAALATLEAHPEDARADCDAVRRVLGEGHVPSRAVVEMIEPWL